MALLAIDVAAHGPTLLRAVGTDPSAQRNGCICGTAPIHTKAAFLENLAPEAVSLNKILLSLVERGVRPSRRRRVVPPHGTKGGWRRSKSGSILFTPALQRTRGASRIDVPDQHGTTFETLGDRRYEWKCNALQRAVATGRRAPWLRLCGHLPRQHMIVKGRSRDTAWFALLATSPSASAVGYALLRRNRSTSLQPSRKHSASLLGMVQS